MCVMSMIMDHYYDKWRPRVDPAQPYVPASYPAPFPPITPEEVEELRELLRRAREYDRKNNQPDCELDEKRQRVKELAETLGVKIDFLDD